VEAGLDAPVPVLSVAAALVSVFESDFESVFDSDFESVFESDFVSVFDSEVALSAEDEPPFDA